MRVAVAGKAEAEAETEAARRMVAGGLAAVAEALQAADRICRKDEENMVCMSDDVSF